MSTLPLEVHEVLEEEYRTMHDGGPEVVGYGVFEIIDLPWARGILCSCGVKPEDLNGPGDIETVLSEFVSGKRRVADLEKAAAMSDTGRTLLADYAEYSGEDKQRLNRRIVDEALGGAIKRFRDQRLSKLYHALHEQKDDEARTAVCISGGGIRSATFALGVLQGLAGAGILEKFHYLSTVSGGGYIGSWLSSWSRRHPKGISGVQDDLVRADTAVAGTKGADGKKKRRGEVPYSKIDPEAAPVRHLRQYSNYLSPKLGITSGDTWTLVALYLRNLLLNLLVLLPILALLLAIPRFFSLLLRESAAERWQPAYLLDWMLIFLAMAFGYIGFTRPVSQGRGAEKVARFSPNAKFMLGCVLMLTGASTSLALFWAAVAQKMPEVTFRTTLEVLGRYGNRLGAAAGLITLLPFLIYYYRYVNASAAERRAGLTRQGGKHLLQKAWIEFVAVSVGVLTAAALFLLVAVKLFPQPMRPVPDLTMTPPFLRPLLESSPMGQIYVALAVPVGMAIFFVQASIFVGLSGRQNEDDDREWWGRAGAWLLFAAVVVAALGAIAIFGPVLLYRAPVILGSIGGLSGIAAALVGFSGKTPANEKQKGDSAKGSAVSSMASAIAVPLFVVVALAAISLGTTWLLQRFDAPSANEKLVGVLSTFTSEATHTMKDDRVELKLATDKLAITSLPVARSIAHLKTIDMTTGAHALAILAAGLAAFGLSFCIGVNKFSMHALYRNRLIRAYLGASRYTRDPDRFTGFDENDNLQMHELRRELVWTNTFGDGLAFVNKLLDSLGDSVTSRWPSFRTTREEMLVVGQQTTAEARIAGEIWRRLGRTIRPTLKKDQAPVGTTRDQLILCINDVLLKLDLKAVADGKPQTARPNLRANRQLLAEYDFDIGPPQSRGPIHVINTALNLVSGKKLAWQERKAESFTVTPLHSGSPYVGYRDTHRYGGAEGISIGTAVTISGAAASPNMGYNSSIPMAFLLTLFNVRLGWWLGNPGPAGRRTFNQAHPRSNVTLLANEMIGETSDQYEYVYLSDGGHFENLGIYEMVLRRCRYIVVSDGGCDPKCSFDDLGNAIRKIRTDLGVPVDIVDMFMYPRTDDGALREGSYVAKAKIRYSAIDGLLKDGTPAKDGTLIYIKPGLYTGDYFPRDVYNYAHTSPTFPHEPTSDQFFSESQFESYRALGRHAINEICGNYEKNQEPYAAQYDSVAEFANAVKAESKRKDDAAKQIADAITGLANISLVRPSTPPLPPA